MTESVGQFVENLWHILLELSPWLLLGMVIAGVLHVFLPEGFILKHMGGRKFADVFKAVAIGVPMPLCSCGVIPAALGLKKEGASDGASVGFLISTPQTGVDSILVSATFLGWPFAIFKVFAALLSGLVGGVLVNLFDKSPAAAAQTHSEKACCHASHAEHPIPQSPRTFRLKDVLHFALIDLLKDIYRWLLIGILLAALISTLLPENSLKDIPWTQGLPGMLMMLAISIPMYICTTASAPLAASLVAAGMSPGAALVLLMAGPVTNIATLGAILRTFGKNVFAIYLLTVVVLSLLLGGLFNFLLADLPAAAAHLHHDHSLLHVAAAIFLIALFGYFLTLELRAKRPRKTSANDPSCPHCKTDQPS